MGDGMRYCLSGVLTSDALAICDPHSEFQSVTAGVFGILENDLDMGRPPESAFLQVTPEPLSGNSDHDEDR